MKKPSIYLTILSLSLAIPCTVQARGGKINIIEELEKHFKNYGDLTIRSQDGLHTLDILACLKSLQEGYHKDILPESIPSLDVSTDPENKILIWLGHKLDNLKQSLEEQKQARDFCRYQKRLLPIRSANMLSQSLALYCHTFYPDHKNTTLALQISNVVLSGMSFTTLCLVNLPFFLFNNSLPESFITPRMLLDSSFCSYAGQLHAVKYANFSRWGNVFYNQASCLNILWPYSIYNRKNIALRPNIQLLALGLQAVDAASTGYYCIKLSEHLKQIKTEILQKQNISTLIPRIESYQRRVFDRSLIQSLSGRYDLVFQNAEKPLKAPIDVRGQVWDINKEVSGIIAQYKSDKASIIRVKNITRKKDRSISQKVVSWLTSFVLLSGLGTV